MQRVTVRELNALQPRLRCAKRGQSEFLIETEIHSGPFVWRFSLSCRFGMTGEYGDRAQRFADEKNIPGYAPNGWVNFSKRGDVTTLTVWSGRDQSGKQGAWQNYVPGGKGPVKGGDIGTIRINTKTGKVSLDPPPPRLVDSASSAAGPGGTTGSLKFDP